MREISRWIWRDILVLPKIQKEPLAKQQAVGKHSLTSWAEQITSKMEIQARELSQKISRSGWDTDETKHIMPPIIFSFSDSARVQCRSFSASLNRTMPHMNCRRNDASLDFQGQKVVFTFVLSTCSLDMFSTDDRHIRLLHEQRRCLM